MHSRKPLIVGIGGTTRTGSSSEQALRMALSNAERLGADTAILSGADIELPMYDGRPENLSEKGRSFVETIRKSDGIIISSPCYHGGVSGLIKNAIDYIEELRSDERTYLDHRAVGMIGCGSGYQGASMVLAQLRQTAHALRGWPVPLGVAVNCAVVKFADLDCSEAAIANQIAIMAGQVVEFAQMKIARQMLSDLPPPGAGIRQHAGAVA